jgi:tetratricopeptide (TPR) repeat protein
MSGSPPLQGRPDEEGRAHLRRAQELHTQGRIDEALAEARRAVGAAPDLAEAWLYLGTTLITRRLAFEEGLDALHRAENLAPDDPGVMYSLGWCYEFVAHRLQRQTRRPFRDPEELYARAADYLQRCIELEPEERLKEEAEDLRNTIVDRY